MTRIPLSLTVALAIACGAPVPSTVAATITLAAKSGGFDIEGDLKSFDGTTYVIETAAGPMSLPAASYACVGEACPKITAAAIANPAPAANPAASGVARTSLQGSSTIGRELMPDLIRALASRRGQKTEDLVGSKANETEFKLEASGQHAAEQIALSTHGTKSGIAALIRGETTFAMSDRDLTAEEFAQLTQGGKAAPNVHVLGIDGISIIAGSGVDAARLTSQQLARVFSGQVTNWSEVGQNPGPITVYAPEAGQGTRDVFVAAILKPFALALATTAVTSNTHIERVRKVGRDPYGISFVSMSVVGEAKQVEYAMSCGLVTRPTPFAVKSDEYPLSRKLYLFSTGQLDPAAAAFARFTTSSAGQHVVGSHGFIDLAVTAVPFAHEAPRLTAPLRANAPPAEISTRNQLLTDLKGYKRLSVTVRFALSNTTIDARSRQELERLAELLQTPAYASKPILLAGFTDQIGSLQVNQALARKRADQVRSLILARADGALKAEQVQSRGYGPVAPVVCNDTPENQNRNRRVEVWIKE